jgi:putative DNA methylase
MTQPKKLIEVAMPIKEISAESVRDKSIRNGHISTLHLWWARRPLPVCRAVIFASLIPDPEDINCPKEFRDAVEILLGKKTNIGDPYSTYPDIPWTSIFDPMEDTLRNRLQMFIGKFTEPMQQHLLGRLPKPGSGKLLSDFSLIRWENKDDEKIINKARKLIWVAHYCLNNHEKKSAEFLLSDYDKHYENIKNAEFELYNLIDRHIESEQCKILESNLESAIESFLSKMPKVFDPFAGGGALPLEAARLGCRSFGNDINPVAHIIQKGSVEFPQKFGKAITYSKNEFIKIYGLDEFNNSKKNNSMFILESNDSIYIKNRLAYDVKYYAKQLISNTEADVGFLYPSDKNGVTPIIYYWVHVGNCNNPTCNAEIPLLRQFYLSKRRSASIQDYVYFDPVIKGNKIELKIKKGVTNRLPFVQRANLKCPICGSVTEVKKLKKQFVDKTTKVILGAVIEDSPDGKIFREPYDYEINILKKIGNFERPIELMPQNDSQNLKIPYWGFKSFGEMFSDRQIVVMLSFVSNLNKLDAKFKQDEYSKAILTYLAILIDRIAMRYNTFSTWHIQQDTVEKIMSKQSISMVFDYPEMNPFTNYTSSAINQLGQIIDYIEMESSSFNIAKCENSASGERNQFEAKYLNAVITDPPYYDAIAYADLSDFFYVWLKRTIGNRYNLNFSTPNSPKSEECTAIKHYHKNNKDTAREHFEGKLLKIFDTIEYQTSDIVSIMFAHQSTEAWTTLCNSILGARMNITGSWAVDTEVTGGLKEGMAYLSSSVTVACVPSQAEGYGEYKVVKNSIEKTVACEVEELYRLGFRGADLLTACFGKAVSEFGKYKKVEKADGSDVTVAELLKLARESAFNALLKGFNGDEYTKFYIGWLQLNGFVESDFDEAATFAKAGLSVNVSDLFSSHLLIKNGNKQTLATFQERNEKSTHLGEKADSFLIDQVHKGMALYKGTDRKALLNFINEKASSPDSSFWRVVTALDELLPKDSEDQIQTKGLITNKESLIRESKETKKETVEQSKLEI